MNMDDHHLIKVNAGLAEQRHIKYLTELEHQRVPTRILAERFTIQSSLNDFLAKIAGLLGPNVIVWGVTAGCVELVTTLVVVHVNPPTTAGHDVVQRGEFHVEAVGYTDSVMLFMDQLREAYVPHRLASVEWWFTTRGGTETNSRSFVLDPSPPMPRELYPWLDDKQPGVYMQEFLGSNESLLFLLGPPGTGKTSLIRKMLNDSCLTALMTYEERLLDGDELFVSFLGRSNHTVLVVEDAAEALRTRDGNSGLGGKFVARFLNVSDGLIPHTGKKIIFTSNLESITDLDPALTRPGRCYDVVQARALTAPEVLAAKKVLDLPLTTSPLGEGEQTLAQLFNPIGGGSLAKPKVGFVVHENNGRGNLFVTVPDYP